MGLTTFVSFDLSHKSSVTHHVNQVSLITTFRVTSTIATCGLPRQRHFWLEQLSTVIYHVSEGRFTTLIKYDLSESCVTYHVGHV